MPSTSGTFNFQSVQIELLIREAFERIGISGEFIEPIKLDSAKRSLDLMLLEWMNKSTNLWTLQYSYLPLNTSQGQYTLPNTVSNIVQANIRTSTRQLDGTAASNPGGVAANAFDGDPTTACTQTGPDGNISYDYGAGVTQQINFVGITSNSTLTYSIVIESSDDALNWDSLYTITPQSFEVGVTKWFDIITPVTARAYRIRETDGATLNIQEIYFNNNLIDLPISAVSRYDYFSFSNKQLQGRPSSYYLDRQITPVLYIWPVPSSYYNCLQYTYKKMMEDTGAYTNAIQVPSRFYPAIIAGLSYQLALKFNPQIAEMLKAEYDKSLDIAEIEDSENVSFNIQIDYTDR
jgi:hypothetical protein